MKKALLILVLALSIHLMVAGVAAAWSGTYDPNKNIHVDLWTDPAVATTLWGLGADTLTFDTQEEAHAYLESKGFGVQHSYIVLNVNGKAVLFIDPPCFYPGGTAE